MAWISEDAALERAGLDPERAAHCSSCHEDVEYGYWLCEIDVGEDEAEVCCTVAGAISQSGSSP